VEFTADPALKAQLEKAAELMRHRVGPGNLVAVIDRALDLTHRGGDQGALRGGPEAQEHRGGGGAAGGRSPAHPDAI
jgi:hypothetical protein